jgi:hypothetical protein
MKIPRSMTELGDFQHADVTRTAPSPAVSRRAPPFSAYHRRSPAAADGVAPERFSALAAPRATRPLLQPLATRAMTPARSGRRRSGNAF